MRHNRVFVGKVKLRTYLSRNFNLRTSEAHFIKKSALRGTAATCDSLEGAPVCCEDKVEWLSWFIAIVILFVVNTSLVSLALANKD